MSISGGIKKLRRLLDVDDSGISTGDAPVWNGTKFTMQTASGGGGGLPQFTHVVNLQSPSALAIGSSPANVVFTNYNGYNFQTEATENDGTTSFNWNDTDTLVVQPGLYEMGLYIAVSTTLITGVYVAVAGADITGVVGSDNYRFIAIPSFGGGMTACGIVEFTSPATISVNVVSDHNTSLDTCTLSFAQLELP